MAVAKTRASRKDDVGGTFCLNLSLTLSELISRLFAIVIIRLTVSEPACLFERRKQEGGRDRVRK